MNKDTVSICLFGTSNAFFADGYRLAFETNKAVNRLSANYVGASSSHLIAYMEQALRKAENSFDICVFECAVNDLGILGAGDMTREELRHILEYGFAIAYEVGAQPVSLILPSLTAIQCGTEPLNIYKNAIEKFGVPFFDGYKFLQTVMSSDKSIEYNDLFRDNAHLHPPLSKMIGDFIAESCIYINKNPQTISINIDAIYEIFDFPTQFLDDKRIDMRETSVLKASFLNLTEGEELGFTLPTGARISAIVIDASRSAGHLTVGRGSDSDVGRSVSDMYWGGRLTLQVIPLADDKPTDTNEIRLRLSEDTHPYRKTFWDKTHGQGVPAVASLAALVVERPIEKQVAVSSDPATCLVSRLSSDWIAAFIDEVKRLQGV